jgi:hypothetical protein
VAHDNDDRAVEVLDSVFQAGNLGIAGHVAGDADVEEVAESLVEDDLGGYPRIGAGQDRRFRLLAGREFVLPLGCLVRTRVLLGGEALVALAKVGEDRVGRWGGCLSGGRHGRGESNGHEG